MKFFAATAVALASIAAAVPTGEKPEEKSGDKYYGCQPATYSCTTNPHSYTPGWQVCDVNGKWVFAGDCPPKTVCKFNEENQSPYCIPYGYSN
ncbi:hypothetical protein HIM_02301 [Hirsutella minnesotensis 3608]|nr:hypothetical protein HIM_02301 [Hirsutella minnesotensis 3608]